MERSPQTRKADWMCTAPEWTSALWYERSRAGTWHNALSVVPMSAARAFCAGILVGVLLGSLRHLSLSSGVVPERIFEAAGRRPTDLVAVSDAKTGIVTSERVALPSQVSDAPQGAAAPSASQTAVAIADASGTAPTGAFTPISSKMSASWRFVFMRTVFLAS